MARVRMARDHMRVRDSGIARADPKWTDPFYLSSPWRSLVARLKRDRGERCERCGSAGPRIAGDHIVEIKDGGARLDPSNIMLLCPTCHSHKTAREARRRAAAT